MLRFSFELKIPISEHPFIYNTSDPNAATPAQTNNSGNGVP